ncbi:TPA: phage tail protein I [Clostridium botulinum]|nr:phage tail protein I [Clostridium botulinum]
MELNNIDLLSLQTSYLQQDLFVKALCKAIEPYFKILDEKTKLTYIYGRIEELDEETIDSLAWQFHVDFYDYTLSLETKKELVKNSIRLHKIKGTPVAVEEAATTVFGRTRLKEWFEYGGEPYYFSLDIDITDRGASPSELKKLDTLINAYKNKRSWTDILNIYLSVKGKSYIGITTMQGEAMTVYPWSPKDIESKGKINISLLEINGVEEITTYPRKEKI